MKYTPKGSMCMACDHRNKNCSKLPFDKMKVMQKLSDGTNIVKCDQWQKTK